MRMILFTYSKSNTLSSPLLYTKWSKNALEISPPSTKFSGGLRLIEYYYNALILLE